MQSLLYFFFALFSDMFIIVDSKPKYNLKLSYHSFFCSFVFTVQTTDYSAGAGKDFCQVHCPISDNKSVISSYRIPRSEHFKMTEI